MTTNKELMQMANRIEAMAFEMKAPNAYTPRFVMLANEIRAALAQPEPPALTGIDCSCGRKWRVENNMLTVSAQPEPEPVATVYDAYDTTGIDWHCKDAPATGTKLYTAQPQREWQGLTDEEIKDFYGDNNNFEITGSYVIAFARAIEAKLKERNAP